MMSAAAAIALYQALEAHGIRAWIDGGWGVDALLGRETRKHNDLDIVLEQKDLAAFRALMAAQGFRDVPRPDTRAWNFVLAHGDGREIDVHVIARDTQGNGIYGPPERNVMYPAQALTGQGTIAGVAVRCTSAIFQVESHATGYTPRPFDIADVTALCKAFGLEMPAAYKR
jgi:lincosamide nucleotidyltransferase A/C/D/E